MSMNDPNYNHNDNDNDSRSEDSGGYQMAPNAMTDFSQSSDSDSDSDSDSNNSYSAHFLSLHENHQDIIQKCKEAHIDIAEYIEAIADDIDSLLEILEKTRQILHIPFPFGFSDSDHIKRPRQDDFEPIFEQIYECAEQGVEDTQHFKELIRTFYWAHMEIISLFHYQIEENMTCREYADLWDNYL